MVTRVVSQVPINFPTKPVVPVAPPLTYPSDIFAPVGSDGMPNQFYTTIRYREHFSTRAGDPNPIVGTITLPIPRKINDVLTLSWSQESFTSLFAALGVNLANFLAGNAGSGLLINPALFMMFKHPNFKVVEMSWTLVADNEQESIQIAKIIDVLKYQASPSIPRMQTGFNDTLNGIIGTSTAAATGLAGGAIVGPVFGLAVGAIAAASAFGGFMVYPSVFELQLYPSKYFTFPIKPCIIEGIAVDYTAGDVPAFHKNGSPVVVNLTVRFKEIEIWEKSTWPTDSPRNSLPIG